MLSCKDITEKANEYIDHELSLVHRVKFRMHLFVCVNCRRYIAQLKTTIQTLGRIKNDIPPTLQDSELEEIVSMLRKNMDAKPVESNKPHSHD